jgi:hypothetical protein
MNLIAPSQSPIDWSLRVYLLVAIGIYALGVAIFVQSDSLIRQPRRLLGGTITVWTAILALVLLRLLFPRQAPQAAGLIWASLLMLAVGYRMTQALLTPESGRIQQAGNTAIAGLVLFDAAIVSFTTGPYLSLPLVLLLIPALWLGSSVRPTDASEIC